MAWTNSKVSLAYIEDSLERTAAFDNNADTFKNALFDNSITPSQTVASASFAYGAGVWASGGVLDASGWPAVGRNLVNVVSSFASNVYTFTADTTVSANSTTTITGAFGGLIYDDTLAAPVVDQGVCYLYFGGSNSVVNGNFSVAYPSGIMTFTA